MRAVNEGKWTAAAELLEEALRDDPTFALAHIYAAHCYSDLNQEDRAAPHYESAFRLAPGVTPRERLFILGTYYGRFLHDDHRALAEYEALLRFIPTTIGERTTFGHAAQAGNAFGTNEDRGAVIGAATQPDPWPGAPGGVSLVVLQIPERYRTAEPREGSTI